MFDIGFWELGLIGVVALLVIGPERLPGVARSAGMWIGRARRFVSTTQAEINKELSKADELRRLMEEQARIKSAHEIIEQTANEVRESLSVPSLKPDYPPKAEDKDDSEESESSPTARPTAAATPTTQAAPPSPNEPLKANDAKHDQSA
ncbi:MAG TPA: twin-arginine translocase subunit TatB [Gammaproteobacteria bacterium]|nr:twin-arginine translocase subunit TatB [Gammaproteobacteria bacterium]